MAVVSLAARGELPIIDPRGLLTPFWDGWPLDSWIVAADGRRLVPSQLDTVEQSLDLTPATSVWPPRPGRNRGPDWL